MEEKDHSSSSTVMKYDIVASIAPSLIATYYWWLTNCYIRLTHQNPCLHLIRWNFPWGMVPLLDFFAYAPPQGLVGLLQFLFFPSVRDKMNQCSLKIKKKRNEKWKTNTVIRSLLMHDLMCNENALSISILPSCIEHITQIFNFHTTNGMEMN